jgi:sterol desaturase/sphingolipid hydroxylase (fatty acid hydroxylase superfamily)
MKLMVAGLLVLIAMGIALGVWQGVTRAEFRGQLGTFWTSAPASLWRAFAQEILLNPWFYGVFALVCLLEWLIPANPEQKTLSKGVLQDAAIWVPFGLLARAFVLPLHILFLHYLYDRYLSGLTIHAAAAWPSIARLVLALLAGDLLFWISHWVRHKVSVLWYFHAVHHSQRELNFFTEYRVHPLDDVFLYTIGFIPLFMLNQSFVDIVAITWIRHWHTRMYHSNIRTNLGWLRYVFVTPQSHRVHHSIEPRHYDTNFGLTFSLWDQLFGTQYRGYDEYPATGIDDERFPFEQGGEKKLGALGRLASQLLYPFQAIAREAGGAAEPAHGHVAGEPS